MDVSIYSGLVGKPFAEDGRGPRAWNCGELVLEVFKRAGITVARPEYDGSVFDTEHRLFELGEFPDWTLADQPYQELDVIVLRNERFNAGVHCGLFVPPDRILHAIEEVGVCCEALRRVKPWIIGVYRHRAATHINT
jgi:hypothetical protein